MWFQSDVYSVSLKAFVLSLLSPTGDGGPFTEAADGNQRVKGDTPWYCVSACARLLVNRK